MHGPGDVQGAPYRLDDEAAEFLWDAYAVDDGGRRLVRRAAYSRPKGRAKSELAAAIACAEALGPVRFNGWEHDGTPAGRPVTRPIIPCIATEEGQATDTTYSVVAYMLEHGPIAARVPLDVGRTRTFLPDGGVIRPLTSAAASKDGGRETFAVLDETHLYVTDELRNLAAVIRRNLTKRKIAEPWSLEVGTMYAPGERSVAESTHMTALALEREALERPEVLLERGLLFDHRQGPEPGAEFDWDDDKALMAALREAYGEAAEWIDLRRILEDARDPETERLDVVRYFLNRPAVRGRAWITPAEFDGCKIAGAGIPDGDAVALGFDGSTWQDATVLTAVSLTEGRVVGQVLDAWQGTEEHPVDHADVTRAVEEAFERWHVARLYGDPYGWQEELATWAATHGPGVRRWATTSYRAMADALEALRSAIRLGTFAHDGSNPLREHVLNARTVRTRGHTLIVKPVRQGPRKIDAAVSMALAWQARVDAMAAGEHKVAKGRSKRMRFR